MRNTKSIYFLFATLLFASCNESKSKSPNSTGLGSEIIVVCGKQKWNGPIGDTIRGVLMQYMQGLPEAESEYTLINIPKLDFSKFLKLHHNVLIVDIKAENIRSKVETLRNVWSFPQRVIKIKASSDTAFIDLFAIHSEAIKELFNQNERARFSIQNSLKQNSEAEKILSDEFGITMVIAKDFYQVKKAKDFI